MREGGKERDGEGVNAREKEGMFVIFRGFVHLEDFDGNCVFVCVCEIYESGLESEWDMAPAIMTLCGFLGGWVDISWTSGVCVRLEKWE